MDPTPKPEGNRSILKSLGIVLGAALLFVAGVNVGNGRLTSLQFLNKKPVPVATNLPATLDYSGVNQVYQSIKANYDGNLTATQLQDGLKHGLATATKDPYTVYFTSKEAHDFEGELNSTFTGIGAQLGQDSDGNLLVISPIAGLPADKAGIKPQDIIATINGTSTTGMSIDDAVSKIRGPKGTKVTLQIIRNKKDSLSFTIVRDDIKLPSVNTKILDGNIGYAQITIFGDDTAKLMTKAAQDFKSKNVNGIILDLRGNPGGLLTDAVDISSLWLPEGQNVLQEKRGGKIVTNSYSALGGDVLKGVPTVILLNAGSASASEITAGALHDNKAAYIIGEKSYGKGVVQQIICITGQRNRDGTCPADELKVTVGSWYRPNGQNINHKGITPDKIVKISDEDAKAGNDTQLQAAQTYLSK